MKGSAVQEAAEARFGRRERDVRRRVEGRKRERERGRGSRIVGFLAGRGGYEGGV